MTNGGSTTSFGHSKPCPSWAPSYREEARRETWVNRGKGAEKAAQYLIDKVQELTKKEEK